MSNRKLIFEIAAVYTAVIIGAGFATLEICRLRKLTSFDELIGYTAGRYVGRVIKLGAVAFLFVVFAAMLSATGALGAQLFGLPSIAGSLVMALCCFAAFSFDLRGLVRINTFLAPVMLLGSIALGLYSYFTYTVYVFGGTVSAVRYNWASSAVLYASYNMVAVVSILTAMSSSIRTRREALFGTLLGAGAVTLIALCLALGLSRGLEVVQNFQIPFLRLVQDYGTLAQWAYVAVLAAAVYTTAISNGYCFYITALGNLRITPFTQLYTKSFVKLTGGTKRFRYAKVAIGQFAKGKPHRPPLHMVAKAGMCGAALAFSQIEFTRIVESVYPLFGLIGLLLALILLITATMRKD